jgi:hypothetical protein
MLGRKNVVLSPAPDGAYISQERIVLALRLMVEGNSSAPPNALPDSISTRLMKA